MPAESDATKGPDLGEGEPFLRIAPAEARRLIEGGAHVIDVRRPAEFAEAHIAGSLNIDADDLFRRRAQLCLDDDIVVACRIGVVSAYGAEILAMLGATRVYNLEGGIEEWGRLGYPLEGSRGIQPADG